MKIVWSMIWNMWCDKDKADQIYGELMIEIHSRDLLFLDTRVFQALQQYVHRTAPAHSHWLMNTMTLILKEVSVEFRCFSALEENFVKMFILSIFMRWIIGISFSSFPWNHKSIGQKGTYSNHLNKLFSLKKKQFNWRYLFRLFTNYLQEEILSLPMVICSRAVSTSWVIACSCQVSEQFLLLRIIVAVAARSPKWFCATDISIRTD